jgi:hypothetical protein
MKSWVFLSPFILLFQPAEASSQYDGGLTSTFYSDGFNGGNFGVHQPPHLERNTEGKTYGAVFVVVGTFSGGGVTFCL